MAGPTTRDTSSLALGLAQIRVGTSATYIANPMPVFTASDSIGSLTQTKFMGETEWYQHASGFPKKDDYAVVLSEKAALECAFEEVSPYNIALAMGIDPATYTDKHSGEVALGGRTSPVYVRMEAVYTYPNGTDTMTIIFPRAQATSSMEMDLAQEEATAIPMTFESKLADSTVSGGNAAWDSQPLGRIIWQ